MAVTHYLSCHDELVPVLLVSQTASTFELNLVAKNGIA